MARVRHFPWSGLSLCLAHTKNTFPLRVTVSRLVYMPWGISIYSCLVSFARVGGFGVSQLRVGWSGIPVPHRRLALAHGVPAPHTQTLGEVNTMATSPDCIGPEVWRPKQAHPGMVTAANSTRVCLTSPEAGPGGAPVESWVTPRTSSALQLLGRNTKQKGKACRKLTVAMKAQRWSKCPRFCRVLWAARGRTSHLSSWPSSCHLLWIIFLGYSLTILLHICIYPSGIFNLVQVSTFESSWRTWRSIENVLLKWRED